jgi:hypothetical protein
LRDAAAEPAPLSLDTGYALDNCIRRDGWLVFTPNIDVWGMPLPFGERPFRIATDTHVVATGVDPRTVWLHSRDNATVSEYDGVAREVRREIELPSARFSIAAATPSAFLLHDDHQGLYEWEPAQPPQLLLDDVGAWVSDEGHTRIACQRLSTDELIIFDLTNGSHVTVPRPEGCRWRPLRFGVFSPDGRWFAVDLDYSPPIAQEESLATIRAIATGRLPTYEPYPHRLAIIRLADGVLTLADTVHDNFANIVWSLDSEWIVFNTPFAPRGLWLTRPDDPTLEWISFGRRHAPSLLCDASDLLI